MRGLGHGGERGGEGKGGRLAVREKSSFDSFSVQGSVFRARVYLLICVHVYHILLGVSGAFSDPADISSRPH